MFIDLINKLDDRMNPIVVKEIRQYLNGRTVVPLILFTLLLELGAMFIFMLSQSNSIEGHGKEFFIAIMVVLSLACVVGIGFPAAGRLTQERKPDAPDLMYSTALSPHRIISGKLFSGMTMVILLISLCLPFMCVSYYLRGIDLPTILTTSYLLLLFMLPFILVMLMIGLMFTSVVYRTIIVILGVIMLFNMISPLFRFLNYGGFSAGGPSIGWVLFWMTFATLIVSAGLYVLCVSMISHITANRAMPIRIYLAATWAITITTVIALWYFGSGKGAINDWAIVITWPFVLATLIAVCERDEQSRRVLTQLPSSFSGRILFFLFSSGSAGGLLFCIVFLLLTHAVNNLFYSGKSLTADNPATICGGIALYVIGYATIAMGIKNWLKRYFININVLAIFVSLAVIFLIVPIIVCAMIYQERCMDNENSAIFTVLSPAIFGYDAYHTIGFITGSAMAILGLILVLTEIKRQAAQYFPAAQPQKKLEQLEISTENADA